MVLFCVIIRLYTKGKKLEEENNYNIGHVHRSLVETIVENLETLIISGKIKPGERIIEQKLCEEFGVSRSPLREAFRILEKNGFLNSVARKGVSVTEISRKEGVDIYTLRANLESLAVYLAVKNRTPEFINEIKTLHNKMKKYVEKNDVKTYMKLNRDFHKAIIQASNNEKLIDQLEYFAKLSRRYRHVVFSSPGKLEESIIKHEILIESIERGDGDFAEKHRKEDILKNIELIEKYVAL